MSEPQWRRPPTRRSATRPPTVTELSIWCPDLVLLEEALWTQVRLPANAARSFAEAVRLGSVWGKSAEIVGVDHTLRVVCDVGTGDTAVEGFSWPFPNVSLEPAPHGSPADADRPGARRRCIHVPLRLRGMAKLARLLRSEDSDFRYPLAVHWLVQPDLR